MSAAGFVLVALAVLVGYEAFKHFGLGVATAQAASAPSPATSPSLATGNGPGSAAGAGIPGGWLTALAANESPSALQGNFQYGVFGLSANSTPGIGYPGGNAYGSLDPRGGQFTPQIYNSWEQAVQGFSYWVNRYAPSAWQYAASGDCLSFFTAINNGGYGGGPSWPSDICRQVP